MVYQYFILNFSYELIEDVVEGIKLKNGSWTGRVGYVARKEADIAVPTGITPDRLDVIDYSNVRDVLPVKFAIEKPNEMSKVLALIYPFDVQVWIIMTISLIVTGLLFYFILNFDAKIHKRKSVKLYDIIWALFGSFANQGSSLFEVDGNCRMMVFCWLISLFTLVASYSGALMSFLTFMGYEYVPQTFPELIQEMEKGHYTTSLLFHTGVGNYLIDATKDNPLLLRLKELNDQGKVINVKPTDDIFESLLISKNALIEYESDLFMYVSALGADQYMISKDILYTQYEVYTITKGFRYKKVLNNGIRRMFEAGLIQQLINVQVNVLRNSRLVMKKFKASAEPLTFSDLIGAFAFLLIGYSLSIVVFVLEITKRVGKRRLSGNHPTRIN